MKVMRWYWMREGAVRFHNVTYDGVTATTEKADLINSREEISVDPTAILVAVNRIMERRKQKRSDAAKKAALTRARRKTKRFEQVVSLLRNGGILKPRSHCGICERRLTDPESRQRGIGPECWEGVIGLFNKAKETKVPTEGAYE